MKSVVDNIKWYLHYSYVEFSDPDKKCKCIKSLYKQIKSGSASENGAGNTSKIQQNLCKPYLCHRKEGYADLGKCDIH